MSRVGEEFRLYKARKDLWACLLVMKHCQADEYKDVREAIKAALGEDGLRALRKCWREATEEGLI